MGIPTLKNRKPNLNLENRKDRRKKRNKELILEHKAKKEEGSRDLRNLPLNPPEKRASPRRRILRLRKD